MVMTKVSSGEDVIVCIVFPYPQIHTSNTTLIDTAPNIWQNFIASVHVPSLYMLWYVYRIYEQLPAVM